MKIAYLITAMYNSAGMERTVANKANYFSEKGHEVTIITTDQNNQEYFYPIAPTVKKVDLGINFFKDENDNILKRVLIFLKKNQLFKTKLKKYLFYYKHDIVVSLMYKSAMFLYKINDGSSKIYEHHFSKEFVTQQCEAMQWGFIKKSIYKVREFFIIRKLAQYDCFAVLTYEDASAWKKYLNNVVVVPNSINYNESLLAPLQNKIVISIGRLDYQKGYDLLCSIWKTVVERHPDWKLLIYGEGKLKNELQTLINNLFLTSSVEIHEPVKNITDILVTSSIYVLSSRFEGLPMVLLESMSVGVPVIAFKCKCGPSDIIEDGKDGFLVDCFDTKDFADRIMYLIENEEKRISMGRQCKIKMANYSHEVICERWGLLYKSVIDKKRKI